MIITDKHLSEPTKVPIVITDALSTRKNKRTCNNLHVLFLLIIYFIH